MVQFIKFSLDLEHLFKCEIWLIRALQKTFYEQVKQILPIICRLCSGEQLIHSSSTGCWPGSDCLVVLMLSFNYLALCDGIKIEALSCTPCS